MSQKLTKAQKRVIEALRGDMKLWIFGDKGLEMQGLPETRCWYPQWRTVNILLEKGLLQWKPYKNETQCECGIRELEAK